MSRVIYGEFVNGKIEVQGEVPDIEWAKAVIVLTDERKKISRAATGQLQFGKYADSSRSFSSLEDFKADRWDVNRDTVYGD